VTSHRGGEHDRRRADDRLQDAKDVGGGKLIEWVKDADGDVIGLLQPA
jgi:hypothetical protein